MAKRKSSSSRAIVVRPTFTSPRAAAPIIKVPAPRVIRAGGGHKKTHHRRGKGGGSVKNKMLATAVAGYALGMVDKTGTNLPTVPMLGRAGTIAAVALFLGKGQGIWGEVALAAAAIAGYEFGSTGKIAGAPVSQVSGVSSQV